MATFTKLKLSGSTDGRAIKIVPIATAGTTLHTAHATALDEVWLYFQNNHTLEVVVTIEWGNASTDDNIKFTISPANGLLLAVPGLLITNSLVVKAFASVANVVFAHGFVNRIA